MAGTLTTSAGATSFRFLSGDNTSSPSIPIPASNLHIRCRKGKSIKASLHAVIDEPVVESSSSKVRSMSLYDVLNVNRNATISEIKSAYRRLAKRYHPDACGSKHNNNNNNNNDDDDGGGDDDRDFIEICNAYVTLSDPTSRALYDLKMSAGFEPQSGGLYAGARKGSGFYAVRQKVVRRWETDQCW